MLLLTRAGIAGSTLIFSSSERIGSVAGVLFDGALTNMICPRNHKNFAYILRVRQGSCSVMLVKIHRVRQWASKLPFATDCVW